MNRTYRIKQAFTLVELLVVISIIALLLAVLMPSLQKARDKAKEIVCMVSTKNQGIMCQTYASDASGKYPDHANMWPSTLRDWYSPPTANVTRDTPISSRPNVYTTDLTVSLKDYVGNPKVLYCPFKATGGGPKGPDRYDSRTGYSGWNGGPRKDAVYWYCDYAMWFNFRTPESLRPDNYTANPDVGIQYYNGNKAVRRTSDATSRRAIVTEGTGIDTGAPYYAMYIASGTGPLTWKFRKGVPAPPQSIPHPFTVGGSNVLYGDFHAEKRRYSDIKGQIGVTSTAAPYIVFYW